MSFKSEHPLYVVGRLYSFSQRLDCQFTVWSFAQRGLNYNLEGYPLVVLHSFTVRCPSQFDWNNWARAMRSASAEDILHPAPCVSVLDVAT